MNASRSRIPVLFSSLTLFSIVALGAACSPVDETPEELDLPETYAYESRFRTGESSVRYDGQVFRHLLLVDMTSYVGGLTARIDSNAFAPAEGDVAADLESFFDFDVSTAGDLSIGITTTPATVQTKYADFPTTPNLVSKVAGNDPKGQHKDWTKGMAGWGDGTVSPEALLRTWFQRLDVLAAERVSGTPAVDPFGNAIPVVHVTPEGLDLQQLIQKFATGAISISQAADKYLDADVEGTGLLADNEEESGEAGYTALEHQWDEGFGYFGAARDYGSRTVAEVAKTTFFDTDEDGSIDLLKEYTFGHASNAAKRDNGSAESARSTFRDDAFRAFRAGRALITAAGGALTEEQSAKLIEHRDAALLAWEKAIAATVVHYINDTLGDMAAIGTDGYSFTDHAKHWGELKGFALVLQFFPNAQLNDEQFAALHANLGDAPVITDDADALSAYEAKLLEARNLVGDAYGFDGVNVANW